MSDVERVSPVLVRDVIVEEERVSPVLVRDVIVEVEGGYQQRN
jgi:hypothetical protein